MTDLFAALDAAITRAVAARKAKAAKETPSWTECPLPVCRGAVHHRAVVAADGDVEMVGYCSSCGLPTG